MKYKYKLIVDCGFVGAVHEDVIEYDEEPTEQQLEEAARDFMLSVVEYYAEPYTDDE